MTLLTDPVLVPNATARPRGGLVLPWFAALALSCGAPDPVPPIGDSSTAGGTSAGGAPAVGGSAGGSVPNPLGRARCTAPPGVNASPRNTEEAVLLLNALPKPTSTACFVESLARPLTAYATFSVFSAQPALSVKSPRVFLKLGQLWVSLVIDGDSSYLLEFGTQVADDPSRSIKGELLLPVHAPVSPSAPYDRVLYGTGTACGLCHTGEERVPSIPFATAFSSIAFRPRPDSRVSIDELRAQAQGCDWQVEPHRCEMLSAVFGGGAVTETAFPDSMATFF